MSGVPAMRSRHTHAVRAPQLAVSGGWLVLMAAANLATPLYAVYAKRFGFSTLVLTTVFATYAAVLVPALVLFGRLSDRFGRRPVMVASLGVAACGLLLFSFATGPHGSTAHARCRAFRSG